MLTVANVLCERDFVHHGPAQAAWLDSPYSPIYVPIPPTKTTPLDEHHTSSSSVDPSFANSSAPSSSILIGSLPIPLSSNVHPDQPVAHRDQINPIPFVQFLDPLD
nr:hypothetical protein CFP56_58647 [Quercus suber]